MYTVGGLFSGIGGIESGFEKAGFKTLWSNENDPYSIRSFQHNYKHKLYPDDIRKLDFKKIFRGQFAIIGNFPYNISSQILFKIIDNRLYFFIKTQI